MNKQNRLKRVRKWIEDKPPFIVNIALEAATSVDETLWWLKYDINQKNSQRKIALPDPNEWLKLYKKSFHFQMAACFLIFDYPRGVRIAWIFRCLRGMVHQAHQNKEKLKQRLENVIEKMGLEKFHKRAQTTSKILSNAVEQNIEENLNSLVKNDDSSNEHDDEFINELMRSQEISFLLRVWFPCFYLHHMEPGMMLRQARQGNTDMLDKLLRIDKMIIYDPQIQPQFIQMKYGPNKSGLRTFNRAFVGGPTGGINRKKVVKGTAHFVHSLFEALGHKITIADVKEFFDAIASAKKSGCLNEADIASEQALKKAIERASRDEPWPAFQGQK